MKRTSPTITLAALALGGISYAFMQSLVAPALPDIRDATHASDNAVTWVLSGFLLSASIFTPIMGRLGDRYGKERLLIITLVVMGVGTLIDAVTTNIGLFIAGRIVGGIGGGIFPLAFGIIRDEFPQERVAASIGLMSSLLGIGGAAGVVLAGVIVDNLDIHYLFWFPLIAIAAAIVATIRYVPESPIKKAGSINWLGAALMSVGIAALLLAVTNADKWGWGSARTIGLFTAGLVEIGLWIVSEMRSGGPLVDMRMMRVRGVWTTNLAAALVGVGMYSSFRLIPQFVQEPVSTGYGFGASTTAAGVFLLPSSLAMIVVAQFTGPLERRFGSKTLLMTGNVFAMASFVMLALARSERWEVYVASLLLGLGIGLAFSALANLIVMNVRQDQTGVATGMNTVMRTIGGALGSQVAGAFLADQLLPGGFPTAHAYTLGFVMCALALIVALFAGWAIPGRRVSAPTLRRDPALAGARAR
jgi:EmrB/QacA subfamily drug resistance transporter